MLLINLCQLPARGRREHQKIPWMRSNLFCNRTVLEVAKEKGYIGVDCVSYAGLQKKERRFWIQG